MQTVYIALGPILDPLRPSVSVPQVNNDQRVIGAPVQLFTWNYFINMASINKCTRHQSDQRGTNNLLSKSILQGKLNTSNVNKIQFLFLRMNIQNFAKLWQMLMRCFPMPMNWQFAAKTGSSKKFWTLPTNWDTGNVTCHVKSYDGKYM